MRVKWIIGLCLSLVLSVPSIVPAKGFQSKTVHYKSIYAKVATESIPAVVFISYPKIIIDEETGHVRILKILGTGFFINKRGYILSSAHIFHTAPDGIVLVSFQVDRKFVTRTARVLAIDHSVDLALLQLYNWKRPCSVLRFANSKFFQVGQEVIAIGHPRGLNWSVSKGILSHLSRTHPFVDTRIRVLQTDTTCNPGNSGGPLIDLQGKVVGIMFSILTADVQPPISSGLAFAIPANICLDFLEEHKDLMNVK